MLLIKLVRSGSHSPKWHGKQLNVNSRNEIHCLEGSVCLSANVYQGHCVFQSSDNSLRRWRRECSLKKKFKIKSNESLTFANAKKESKWIVDHSIFDWHGQEHVPVVKRCTAHLNCMSLYRQECPSGVVNEETFKHIYAQFFPHGGNTSSERIVFLLSSSHVPLHFSRSLMCPFMVLQMQACTPITCSTHLTRQTTALSNLR